MTKTSGSRGFSLVEVIVSAAVISVLATSASILSIGIGRTISVTAAQASNVALANAVRSQLARRSTCTASLAAAPNFLVNGQVNVRIGADTVVGAGADLPGWKLNVQSLVVRNLSLVGPDLNGNDVYLGDLVMRAQSRGGTGAQPFPYRDLLVARLAYEVRGGGLVACYSADALADTTEQLRQICSMTTSYDGVPAAWNGSVCVIPDNTPPTTCGSLGGAWNGSSCVITVESFATNAGRGYGTPGGIWYPAYCPDGARATGVFSLSGNGASPPMYSMLGSNAAWSSWPPGYEETQFVYSGKCVR